MKLFHRFSTLRVKRRSSHEIDPEDVFIDSQNLSELNLDQMEGHLERPLGKHIFYIAIVASFFLLTGFSYRLFSMQVLQVDEYTEKNVNYINPLINKNLKTIL